MLRIFRGAGLDFASLVDRGMAPSLSESALSSYARAGLEMLVRRTVVALGERRALTRLALARRCATARNTTVEGSGFDLRLDERAGRSDSLADRPGDLGLGRDWEIAPDVLKERSFGLRKVQRVGGQALHRLLAGLKHLAPVLDPRLRVDVGVYQVLNRAIDRPRVLIHTRLDLHHSLVRNQYSVQPVNPSQSFVNSRLILRSGSPDRGKLKRFEACHKVRGEVFL